MNAKATGTRNQHRSIALLGAAGYTCTRAAASLGLCVWNINGIGPTDTVLMKVKARDCPGRVEKGTLRKFVREARR